MLDMVSGNGTGVYIHMFMLLYLFKEKKIYKINNSNSFPLMADERKKGKKLYQGVGREYQTKMSVYRKHFNFWSFKFLLC